MRAFLISLGFILFSCASADFSRHFTISFHRDSSAQFWASIQDSLPQLGYQIYHASSDTLITKTYIKQGALNEREIEISVLKEKGKGKCSVYVKTVTYFRQDTIIEYYDENRGFPASYRKDFSHILGMIDRMGKKTLKKK
ncbi:MAG: hypothetical protein ACKOX1_06795 [Ignavibacteria bacterium]